MIKLIIRLLLCSFIFITSSHARPTKLSGPRVGITTFTPGEISDYLNTHHVTQYGWQFETRFTDGEDFMGLVEWVILAGGMEKGYFLPSVSSLIGFRGNGGFEFGIGPKLSLTGIGLVYAAGYNFKLGKVNLPINLSWVPSKNSSEDHEGQIGHRISLTIGFNMDSAEKK
jgi:hypothetical protein